MNKSFYYISAAFALLMVGGNSCGKSAEEKAAQAKQDSIDSVHRADSVFEAQTQHMLDLDTFIDKRSDSIHNPQKYAPVMDLDKDAEGFVNQVMEGYVRALNRGANVSTHIGGDVTNKVLSQLTDLNGGPSQATDADGNRVRYELKSVKDAGNHWFTVTWTRGQETLTTKVRVAKNGPKKLRIEEMK
ncbi:MAG: hypothetical protein Q4B68_07960 [Bacteroidales bacterium]|nr:hypothetical protein [Bacteroidales bacterium]